MQSSRPKALVVATVTGIPNTYVTYPYCTVCYGKLNKHCHTNKWICIPCQIDYESGCIPYQYCLRLNIADETSHCSISVFGKTLQPYFGLAAVEMQQILDLQHSDQVMEALKNTFVGKSFIFEFKSLLVNEKESSNLCLSSILRKNGNSLFNSNLVAYQIISNNSTCNDTVYSYLMQSNQLSFSKRLKIDQSDSLQRTEIIDLESSISCSVLSYDSTSQESIVLSWEIKQSNCQNSKIPLTVLHSNNCSSSLLLNSSLSKVRDLTFPDRRKSLSILHHLNLDKNKSLFKETNHRRFSSEQLHFLFTEKSANINEFKKKEICPHSENISVSEMYRDDVELEKALSVNVNKSRKSVNQLIGSEDLSSILIDFDDERVSESSLKIIETCKQHSIQKSSLILFSPKSSLHSVDVNNSIRELFELMNHTYPSNATNLSGDLFETTTEKRSNFSEKCYPSDHGTIFLKSTPNLQKENGVMPFHIKPNKSLLLCSHTPNKDFSHSLGDSNDSQFFSPTQSHSEIKSNLSVIIPTPDLQRREKQKDNSKTVFSQNKLNKPTVIFRQNDSCQCSKSTGSKKNVEKCLHKANLIRHPFKSCSSSVSSLNKLTSKSYIAKIKTNICRKTFSSTPVMKNVPALISSNNSSPIDDAFGTPIQRIDLIQESIYCDSPSLLQESIYCDSPSLLQESIYCDSPSLLQELSPPLHGFVSETPKQNEASFDLFTSSNDAHGSSPLSLQVSPKKLNEISQDLFSQETKESSVSNISKCFNRNNHMTPISLKSTADRHLTHSNKNHYFLTKRNILQESNDFFDYSIKKELGPLYSEIEEDL